MVVLRGPLGTATQGVGPAPSSVRHFDLRLGSVVGGLLFMLCCETGQEGSNGGVRVLLVFWLLRVEQQVMTCLLLLFVHVFVE